MSIALQFLKGFTGWLSRVPWQAYALIGAGVFIFWLADNRFDAGRESVLSDLREKQAAAARKAEAAQTIATEKALERSEEFQAQQEVLQDAIEQAEATDSNPLDAIIGVWGED